MTQTLAQGDLRPGDVLLYKSNSTLGKLIRMFDGGAFNHAAIYDGSDVVEALGKGITKNTLANSI